MATFSERLKQLRKEKNISLDGLAEALNTTKATLSRYENNLRVPNIDFIEQLAEFFEVSVDYILGRTQRRASPTVYASDDIAELPILGVVRAGEPLYAEQNILGYFKIDKNIVKSGEHFCLKVTGDSMDLSSIKDGQLVLVRVQNEVENGEIALVMVDGEDATIKKFYKQGDIVTLMPHSSNPIYQPRVIDLKKESAKVIGKVTGTFISF